ncbi:hypothetical protein MBLNU230_g2560t1 [Neophaeotheca triangularis]
MPQIEYLSKAGIYHCHLVENTNKEHLLRRVEATETETLDQRLRRPEHQKVRSRIPIHERSNIPRFSAVVVDRTPPGAEPVTPIMSNKSEAIEISDSDDANEEPRQKVSGAAVVHVPQSSGNAARANAKQQSRPVSRAESGRPKGFSKRDASTSGAEALTASLPDSKQARGILSSKTPTSGTRSKLTSRTKSTQISGDDYPVFVRSAKVDKVKTVIDLANSDEPGFDDASNVLPKSTGARKPSQSRPRKDQASHTPSLQRLAPSTKRPRGGDHISPLSALRQEHHSKRRRTESVERPSGVSNLSRKLEAAKTSSLTPNQSAAQSPGSRLVELTPSEDIPNADSVQDATSIRADASPGAERPQSIAPRDPPKSKSPQRDALDHIGIVQTNDDDDDEPSEPVPQEELRAPSRAPSFVNGDGDEAQDKDQGEKSQEAVKVFPRQDVEAAIDIPQQENIHGAKANVADSERQPELSGSKSPRPCIQESPARATEVSNDHLRKESDLEPSLTAAAANAQLLQEIAKEPSTKDDDSPAAPQVVDEEIPSGEVPDTPVRQISAALDTGAPVSEPTASDAPTLNRPADKIHSPEPVVKEVSALPPTASNDLSPDHTAGKDPTVSNNIDDITALAADFSTFAKPQAPASAAKLAVGMPASEMNYVERVWGKYQEEYRGDNEYWTRRELHKARQSVRANDAESAHGAAKLVPSTDVFKRMKRLQGKAKPSDASETTAQFKVQTLVPTKSKSELRGVPIAIIDVEEAGVQDLPLFMHYVTIKNNVLAPNINSLHFWPYFGDDYPIEDVENLGQYYELDIRDRPQKIRRLVQADSLEDYAISALQELGCTLQDVLRFFLDPSPSLGIDSSVAVESALRYRDDPLSGANEEFDRKNEKWVSVLSKLPPSPPATLARTAIFCETFHKMVKFSLFHIARRHPAAKASTTKDHQLEVDFEKMTCRICLRFMCPHHGELLEKDPSDEEEDEFDADELIAKDIVDPPNINHRTRMIFQERPSATLSANSFIAPTANEKSAEYWRSRGYLTQLDERPPFYPCYHPGFSCEQAECECFNLKIPCEKACNCPSDCTRRFEGCACAQGNKRKICFQDDRCACFSLSRECDADLCGSCGVVDVIDPVNRNNDAILAGRCRNGNIQRGVPKHTMAGDSRVHGFGLYTLEDIRENDFIGEYKGEVITKPEADRRGEVYEHQCLSYLFTLNETQEIDSTYYGNKIRLINSAKKGVLNCYPRIMLVNTVHRIGLYAERHIKYAEELFFNYGKLFPEDKLGGKKVEAGPSAPHARSANQVAGFWDVEIEEDDEGRKTARKAVSKRGRGGTRGRGTRGRGTRGRGTGGGRGAAKGGTRPSAGPKGFTTQADFANAVAVVQDEKPRMDSNGDIAGGSYERMASGDRLAAYNIADDADDFMDIDAGAGAADDEDYHPDHGIMGEGPEQDEGSAESEYHDDELSDDEVLPTRRRGRPHLRRGKGRVF